MSMRIILSIFVFICFQSILRSQESIPVMVKDTMTKEKKCCDMMKMKEKHIVSAEYRQYINPAKGTVQELAQSGFVLDEQAMEFSLKFGQFPKLYYYQQLGTLANNQYVSIVGGGLKEKYQKDFVKHTNIIVAPYLEVGLGFYQLSATRNITSNSIQSALSGNSDESRLNAFSITGDLGVELGFAFPLLGANVHISGIGGFQTNLPSNWKSGHSLAYKEKLDLSSAYFGGKVSILWVECCP